MADNVFRDIGTAITRPVGELFSGAVTALQPGRVQQMQFERQQQELVNHIKIFNELGAMSTPQGRSYIVEKILPIVKASPELIESVQQSQPGLAKPTTVGEARLLGAEKYPVGSPEWDRYIGISQREGNDVKDLWQQWQKNKDTLDLGDLPEPQRLVIEQKNKDLFEQIKGAEGYKITEKEIPGKESRMPFGWGDVKGRTEYGVEKKLGHDLRLEGISTPEMRGDILSGGVQGWPTIPQDEIDVFEQLMPKKSVKQLQKQKARDPNLMELSQIFARSQVPRTEIYKEAANLKPIWNELTLDEKIEAYTLIAEGYKAKEIIKWFKKENNE